MVSAEYPAVIDSTIPSARVIHARRERSRAVAVSASYRKTFKRALEIVMLTISILGILYFINGFMVQAEYEMSSVRSDIITLERENEEDRMEVAGLEAPQRIEKIAETKLGMHLPAGAIYGESDQKVNQNNIKD